MQSSPRPIDPEALLEEAHWVRRLARKLVRDDSLAEDLVQETWLAALESAPAGEGRLRPWLARVVRNFAAQSRRGEAHRAARERISAKSESTPSTSETTERLEAQKRLVLALESLEEPYRTTVTLRYLEGLSAAQIARRDKIPAGTVRWRLKQGLDELRGKLGGGKEAPGGTWALALLPLLRRPPLGEIAAHVVAGSTTAIAEGVLMMNTVTKVGIAAAIVLTASVGVWIQAESPPDPLEPVIAAEPAPLAPPLAGPARVDAAPELTSAAPLAERESAGDTSRPAASAAPAAIASNHARIEVRFLDRLDRPLEGVKVTLKAYVNLAPWTSGSDGRAQLEVELPQSSIATDFLAWRAGLATHFGHVALDAGKTVYLGDVRLVPGGAVAGRVIGPDGKPAGGAEVRITSPEMVLDLEQSRRLGPGHHESAPTGVTIADGTFLVDGVRAGGVRVWAGGDDTRWSFSEPIEVTENSVRDGIELKLLALEEKDLIAGIVLTPDGDPVKNADVRYMGRTGGSSWSGNFGAGKDGRFRHRVQVMGAYELQAHDRDGRWPDAFAIDVQPGMQDVVLQFPRPRWIEVSAKTREGKRIEEFAATVFSEDKKRTLLAGKLEMHEEGRVRLLVPGESFVIDVRARGHGNAVLGPWKHDAAPESSTCTLDTLPGVRGRVRAGEAPVAGARVSLYEVASATTKIERNGFPTRLHPQAEDTTLTDGEGYFQLDPSRPGGADNQRFYQRDAQAAGTFAILCEADGWALAEISPLEIDPAVGVDGIEIAVTKGGAIEGKVLTAPGKDPAGVVVGIDRTDGKPSTKRVGPDGRFRFEHLTPGRFRVSREESEWDGNNVSTSWSSGDEEREEFPTNCSVAEGETTRFDLDLRDDQPCVLVATVTVNGAPATGWTGKLWPVGRSTGFKVPGGAVDALGRLRIEVSEPGPQRLTIEPPMETSRDMNFQVQVEVHRGENNLPVDLRVGAVRGRCAAPPATSSLSFQLEAPGPITCNVSTLIDANGRFEMPYVLAGPARITRNDVHESGTIVGPVTEVKVDVPMGGSVEVDVP